MIKQANETSKYGVLLLLATLNFAMLATSVIVGYKLVPFMGLNLSAGIFAFPISYVCGDIIAEIYGYQISRVVIWTSFICLFVFSLFISFLINIKSADSWHQQTIYQLTLGGTFRLSIAIIFSLIIGDFLNAFLLTKWKIALQGRGFWIRSLGSTALGEAIDTISGFGIAFIGILPFVKFIEISGSTFLVKLFWNILFVIPSSILVLIIKTKLKIDVFDYGTNFNPFKLNST